MNRQTATHPPRSVSGKYVVLAMFAFGVVATGGIWVYWKLQLAPFLPLQKALIEAYPDSSPRVEGGRHKQSPETLRIVMKVPFKPDLEDERVPPMVERIIELAKQHIDVGAYEIFELYLVRYVPEKAAEQIKIERKVRDL